jgi:hypothetical protein
LANRLKDNITSDYFRAANGMTARRARRRIVAYVESYDDIYFWRTVLGPLEDDHRYFEVMLPSRQRLDRGKKSVLMNFIGTQVGPDMIACVDADYDYLLQGATPASRQILRSPYVLHTYVYAIENYQCYAPALHNVCVMATLNDSMVFDFERFFSDFSRACFPLLVWSVWAYRRGFHSQFSISDFNQTTDPGRFTTKSPAESVRRVAQKVQHRIAELRRKFPGCEAEVAGVERDIKHLGVLPERTYLYMQGHHVFDVLTAPMLNKVCNMLRAQRQAEILRADGHNEQKRNEMACYSHSQQDIKDMLKKHTGYTSAPEFQHILNDARRLLRQSDRQAAALQQSRQQSYQENNQESEQQSNGTN